MRTSFTINAHTDVRLVADCVKVIRAQGILIEQPQNYSALIRLIMTSFRNSLSKTQTEDSETAITYLESQGFSTAQKGRRKDAFIKDITIDNLLSEDLGLDQETLDLAAEIQEGIKKSS